MLKYSSGQWSTSFWVTRDHQWWTLWQKCLSFLSVRCTSLVIWLPLGWLSLHLVFASRIAWSYLCSIFCLMGYGSDGSLVSTNKESGGCWRRTHGDECNQVAAATKLYGLGCCRPRLCQWWPSSTFCIQGFILNPLQYGMAISFDECEGVMDLDHRLRKRWFSLCQCEVKRENSKW